MPSHLSRHIASGLISFCIVAVGIGASYLLTQKRKAPAAEAEVAEATVVATEALVPHEEKLHIAVDGSVVPFREVSTSAEVAGRIIFKSPECDAGRFVTAGTRLLQIDPQDYELLALQLTHQLGEADANIEELSAELTNTGKLIELSREDLALQQRELARMANLAVGNVVTESDLDRAKQVELAARNALALLENQLKLQTTRRSRFDASRKLVEAQLEKARLDIARTEVHAVTDGVIVDDLVEEGDYVQKGAPLVMLEDTSSVEVKCSLQMDELYWLWQSQAQSATGERPRAGRYEIPQAPVTVSYRLPQSNVRYEWSGRLSRFDGIGLDEKTRTVPCRVRVDDPLDVKIKLPNQAVAAADTSPGYGPPALVRGMYVDVNIEVNQLGRLVRVPEDAIHPGKAVWIARDGELRIVKPIRLISLVDVPAVDGQLRRCWIADAATSKLLPGDRVITSPLTAAWDGMPIQLGESP